MTKRIISLALAAVLALSALCSCAGKTTSSGAGSAAPDKTSSSAGSGTSTKFTPTYPIVETPITVQGMVVGKDMTNPRLFWTEDLYNLTNIQVEFTNVEKDAFNTVLSTDTWPDFFHNTLSKSQREEFGVLGHKLVNYLDHLDVMPYLDAFMTSHPIAKKASLSSDGGMYGLFSYEDHPGTVWTTPFYNEEFFTKHNLTVPETADEFYEVLKQCKEINNGAAPMVTKESTYCTAIFPAFGKYVQCGWALDGDTVLNTQISDQYRSYLSYMNKLYKEGLLHQEYMTLDTNSMLSLVQQGTGIFFAECAIGVTTDAFSDGKWHIGMLKPLVAKKGDTPTTEERRLVQRVGSFAMNADSKYVNELCRLFDTQFAEDEVKEGSGVNGLAWNYGKMDTVIHINQAEHSYTLTKRDGSDEGYSSNYLLSDIMYDWAGLKIMTDIAPANESNTRARILCLQQMEPYCTGKVFAESYLNFTEEEQSTLDSYNTEFNTYVSQARSQFVTGTEGMDVNDDAVWNNYVNQVKSLHYEDIQKAYQNAYTRFNKS